MYDGKGTLDEGETAEARFIKIQAAYELLMDVEQRRNYDRDNRVNPMKVQLFILKFSTLLISKASIMHTHMHTYPHKQPRR